ncbi:MAG: gliding motility-associated lipoprotein GldK [Microvirga sp.]|jgi:hypothetical protein|nr:gliding motility-associated lipoprotein GldK [Microvirga sp.]
MSPAILRDDQAQNPKEQLFPGLIGIAGCNACGIPENPCGSREDQSYDPRQPQIHIPRRALKGSSHLCAPT